MDKLNLGEYLASTAAGPADGSSNYPAAYMDKQRPKDRRPIYFWAVDLDDYTAIKTRNAQQAIAEAKKLQKLYPFCEVNVREVNLTEQDYREADEKKKTQYWETIIYKGGSKKWRQK